LNTSTWKEVHLHLDGKNETPSGLQAGLTIYLHGKVLDLPIVIQLQELDKSRILAQGEFSFLQSDFGIEPFSVLGGGLQVQDRVQVFFHVEAQKPGPAQRCLIGK
jgi:hypothetical protein